MSARDRILDRVGSALRDRSPREHPGPFRGARPEPPSPPLELLSTMLEGAGAEVVSVPDQEQAAAWLAGFVADYASAAVGETVPERLRTALPVAPPEDAPLAVSYARGAVAETGSLIMDARDGRRAQLLAPEHVVFVLHRTVYATLREALDGLSADLPSAVGLHSGPSKSADIGQILVKGVHGPGRLVAVLIGSPDST